MPQGCTGFLPDRELRPRFFCTENSWIGEKKVEHKKYCAACNSRTWRRVLCQALGSPSCYTDSGGRPGNHTWQWARRGTGAGSPGTSAAPRYAGSGAAPERSRQESHRPWNRDMKYWLLRLRGIKLGVKFVFIHYNWTILHMDDISYRFISKYRFCATHSKQFWNKL